MQRTSASYTILIPIADPQKAPFLLRLAAGILRRRRGRIVVLGVIEVPKPHSLSEAASTARKQRDLLRRLTQAARAESIEMATRVVVSHQAWQGIREAVVEEGAELILLGWRGWSRRADRIFGSTIDEVWQSPPCDVAVVKMGANSELRRILVPVRGGPHAALALQLASSMAEGFDASITLLHVELDTASWRQRQVDNRTFSALATKAAASGRVIQRTVSSTSVERALLQEAGSHDLVVMGGASLDDSQSLLGAIPEAVAGRANVNVVVVKTSAPVDRSLFAPPMEVPAVMVDKWFAERTYHTREFSDIGELVSLKESQGLTISLGLAARNHADTLAPTLRMLKRELVERQPLVDEIIVIDYGSSDSTPGVARQQGIPLYFCDDILPEYDSCPGKGDALWKSLFVLRGDIIAWIDPDIRNIHPKFVYGLVGPLLRDRRIGYVKGFHRRPIRLGDVQHQTGGRRLDELTARPLLNLFFPELSGIIEPLSREHAGRREILEQLPFSSGHGVEVGLLIDVLRRFGLTAIGQADLEERVDRREPLVALSERAFSLVQVVARRLEDRQKVQLLEEGNATMKLIRFEAERFFLQEREAREVERPPMVSLSEYMTRKPMVSLPRIA